MSAPLQAARSIRPWLNAYRSAALRFGRAFARGDVAAIEDAFSRMQELERAFERGEIDFVLRVRENAGGQR